MFGFFGDSTSGGAFNQSGKVRKVLSQEDSLLWLAKLVQQDVRKERVYKTARQILVASRCTDRDAVCELNAIYNAVKHGDSRVPGLENGLKYVNDPQTADTFVSPDRILRWCAEGAGAEDCDTHAMLMCALCLAVGFPAGLRAYAPRGQKYFSHVYAVAMVPKFPVSDTTGQRIADPPVVYGLDTTVPAARVGWEPPSGVIKTAWITGNGIKIEGIYGR